MNLWGYFDRSSCLNLHIDTGVTECLSEFRKYVVLGVSERFRVGQFDAELQFDPRRAAERIWPAEDARAQIKQKNLDSLTPHQRIVYDIVREHGALGPSEIHDRYTDKGDEPRTKWTVRTYLLKMAQYNLLEAEGTSRDRKYSIVDSTAASAFQ